MERARGGSHAAGLALIALSGAAFGCLAIFAKIVYSHGGEPVTVLAVRFAIAGACMLAVMHAGGHPFPRGRVLLGLGLLGGVGYVVQSLAFFFALTVAPAALVSLLLYLFPVLVTVLAAVWFKERLTRGKLVALGVAMAGTALTIGPTAGGTSLGIALGLLAAVAYALYVLLSARVGPRAGAIPSATVVMLSAASVLTVIAVVRGPVTPQTATGWLALVGLALVSTVVAIVAFFAGVERVSAPEASMVSTMEPAVTVVLAAVVLGELISPRQIVGGTLILMAVIMLARAGRPELVPEEAPPA